MASTASLRKMLGLDDEEAVNVPAPGYLESVGVRKMNPVVVNEPRAYEPVLPVPPAATPSGEDIPTPEDRVYFTPDPEGGRPSARALATLGGTPAAPTTAPRPGGPLAGRGKTAPITAPPSYESLAALAPGADRAPSSGGDPTTVNGTVGKMVAGAGLIPGAGAAAPSALDAARRLLEARQASAGDRLIAGMAQAGATAIGKGDAPGLRQLAANAEVPIQEAEKDVARMDRRAEGDARTKAAVEAARRALAAQGLGERHQAEMERHNRAMEARRASGGGAAAEKRRQALEERQVGGLEFAPGRTPSKDDATKMKSTVERVNGILNDLERMSDVYSRKGAEFGWGADLATSQGSREQILLNLKELENLGVLQKLDVDALSRIIPDPNSIKGALSPETMKAAFDNFNRQLRDLVATKAGARGYAVTDPRLRGASTSGRQAGGDGVVRVQAPNGKVKLVPAAQVDAAVAAGGREVQ